MRINEHIKHQIKIAEIISSEFVITEKEDGIELIGNFYYQGYDRIIISAENINDAFFNLKNGIAGEILQKVSNFRMKLVIVGDFSKYESKSLQRYILESNRTNHVNFVSSLSDAINILSV